jgi:hypothetical protein
MPLVFVSLSMSSFAVEFEVLAAVSLGIYFFFNLTLCDTMTQYYISEDMNPLSPHTVKVFA